MYPRGYSVSMTGIASVENKWSVEISVIGVARRPGLRSEKYRRRHSEPRRERLRLPRADAALAGEDFVHDGLRGDAGDIALLQAVLLNEKPC